ncbi:biotin/lipoyl-containing protein [Candidatus Protofrankia californiensis]|uniref:biotin/lipoyl-containing protein n=1 Tax=Candidatus Protofrankia californiensis TaxID=1839754 RepID=UPI0019CFD0BC|nr:biotin/lipoyl-containing protein [Candidatus Protofrankia californiensis]
MSIELRLPQWGAGTNEGTVVEWLKAVGDQLAEGEPLVEVETAKVSGVLEAPVNGVLIEIVAAEGDEVPVGEVLARIEPTEDA